jgi:hypothetical protein
MSIGAVERPRHSKPIQLNATPVGVRTPRRKTPVHDRRSLRGTPPRHFGALASQAFVKNYIIRLLKPGDTACSASLPASGGRDEPKLNHCGKTRFSTPVYRKVPPASLPAPLYPTDNKVSLVGCIRAAARIFSRISPQRRTLCDCYRSRRIGPKTAHYVHLSRRTGAVFKSSH